MSEKIKVGIIRCGFVGEGTKTYVKWMKAARQSCERGSLLVLFSVGGCL